MVKDSGIQQQGAIVSEERRGIWPVALGIGITAVLLLGISMLAQRRRSQLSAVPELTIIAPAADASTDSPLVVHFSSDRRLVLGNSGWGVPGLHLHAWVNDVQYMPAASDISVDSGTIYSWTLPGARRGAVAVRLGWADSTHKALSNGSSQTISSILH